MRASLIHHLLRRRQPERAPEITAAGLPQVNLRRSAHILAKMSSINGGVALEQGVAGSNPVSPTDRL